MQKRKGGNKSAERYKTNENQTEKKNEEEERKEATQIPTTKKGRTESREQEESKKREKREGGSIRKWKMRMVVILDHMRGVIEGRREMVVGVRVGRPVERGVGSRTEQHMLLVLVFHLLRGF